MASKGSDCLCIYFTYGLAIIAILGGVAAVIVSVVKVYRTYKRRRPHPLPKATLRKKP